MAFREGKMGILELGIGWRNQLIKAPLMRLAAREPPSVYVTVNLGEIFIPDEIRDKSYGLDGDLAEILHGLAKERGDGERKDKMGEKENDGRISDGENQ